MERINKFTINKLKVTLHIKLKNKKTNKFDMILSPLTLHTKLKNKRILHDPINYTWLKLIILNQKFQFKAYSSMIYKKN
jgi:hypothetical protein